MALRVHGKLSLESILARETEKCWVELTQAGQDEGTASEGAAGHHLIHRRHFVEEAHMILEYKHPARKVELVPKGATEIVHQNFARRETKLNRPFCWCFVRCRL